MIEPNDIEDLCSIFDRKTNLELNRQEKTDQPIKFDRPLTVSTLSHYFALQCDEFLRLSVDSTVEKKTAENLRSELNKKRGILFEEKLKNFYSRWILHDVQTEDDFLNFLRSRNNEIDPFRIGYNVKFRWTRNSSIESHFKPDFLLVRRVSSDRDRLEITVVDAKSSAKMSIEHCVQVALYSLDLKFWLEEKRLDHRVFINDHGQIWLPTEDPHLIHQTEKFPINKLTQRLEHFFRTDFQRIFRENKLLVLSRCSMCQFSSVCREKVRREQRLSLNNVSFLNVSSHSLVEFYFGSTRIDSASIKRVFRQFDENPHRFDPNERLRLEEILSIDQKSGASRVLQALERGKPVLKVSSYRNLSQPTENLHLLFLCLVKDPNRLNRVTLFSSNIYKSDERTWMKKVCSFHRDPTPSQIVSLIAESLETIQKSARSTCQIVIFDEQERNILIEQLILGSDNADIEKTFPLLGGTESSILFDRTPDFTPFEQIFAAHPLSHLRKGQIAEELRRRYGFQSDSNEKKDDLVKELRRRNDETQRKARLNLTELGYLVSLSTVIRHCFVVPVPGYFDLNDLIRSFDIDYPCSSDDSLLKHVESPDVDQHLQQRFDVLLHIFERIQTILSDSACLQFRAKPLPKVNSIVDSNRYIRRLIFLRQFELMTSLLSCQTSRFEHDRPLISVEVLDKIRVDQYKTLWKCRIKRGEQILLKNSTENLEKRDDFKNFPYIIFEDVEVCRQYCDALHMDWFIDAIRTGEKLDRAAFVHIETIQDDRTLLIYLRCSGIQLRIGQEYGLIERHIDFTTKKSIDSLRNATELTIRILEDPQSLEKPRTANKEEKRVQDEISNMFYKREPTIKPDKIHSLNKAQQEACEKVKEQRVTLVWGPPGTGKTYWSAITVFQLLLFAKSSMRILITAFTHAAIDNLLSTIEFVKEQFSLSPQFDRAHHLSHNLQILKLDSKNVHSVSSIRSSVVVGSTVWKLEKLPPSVLFDVILVDESTQLLTCDSALPLNRLADHVQSKLIVAGDPLQLPPIKRASYPALPDSQPDIFSSLFHCLLRDAQNRRITLESDDPSEEMCRCPYLVVFNENHRMNEDLSDFTRLLYGESYRAGYPKTKLAIKPATETDDGLLGDHLNSSSCLYTLMVESPPERGIVSRQTDLDLESNLIVSLIDELVNRMSLSSIFVIVPHRMQRSTILKKLSGRGESRTSISCDTVERMQGKEAQCVILSMLFRQATLVEDELDFIYNRQRINVSLTRAQQICFLVTSDVVMNRPALKLFVNSSTRNAYNLLFNFINKSSLIRFDHSGRKLT